MHPENRRAFNAAFTPARAAGYADDLVRRAGRAPGFRLAETPVFLTPELDAALATAAREIVAQLSAPDLLARMKGAIPARWDAPGMDALPSLAQVDFAVVQGRRAASSRASSSCRAFPPSRPSRCCRPTPGTRR